MSVGERADRPARLAGYLDRARAGDLKALGEVVRELNPLLWHVARAQGLGAEDAADVVQTTWLELLRQLHDIRTPTALTAWLVSTTRREAWHLNARRRRQATTDADELETLPDPAPDADERLGLAERHQILLRHFRRLTGRCQALLRIVAQVDRPNYDDVALAMDMNRGSIGPTRGRCLAKLREMLLADPAWSAQ